MKSFYDLQIVEQDPRMALHIEDEVPEMVDMTGHSGMRGMSEVLAHCAKASEIKELSHIASSLKCGTIRVLRVSNDAGSTSAIVPGSFDCLDEFGITLFAICDDDGTLPETADEIEQRFAWLMVKLLADPQCPWEQLVTYKSAIRHSGLHFVMPPWLNPSDAEALVGAEPWWGLGVPASAAQVDAFSDQVVERCVKWDFTRGVIQTTRLWLKKREGSFQTYRELLDAFCRDAPLSAWERISLDADME